MSLRVCNSVRGKDGNQFYKFKHLCKFKIAGELHTVKVIEGKTYGILQLGDVDHVSVIQQFSDALQRCVKADKYSSILDYDLNIHLKFVKHYNKPQYKIWKENGLPTVVEALDLPLYVDVECEVSGVYVKDDCASVSFLCKDMRSASHVV